MGKSEYIVMSKSKQKSSFCFTLFFVAKVTSFVERSIVHIYLHTRALLMNSSWHALPFSFLPPQALRAEACRARPYEKVRAQGLCRGHWFMAFRLMEASSSLWPPDRKVMPLQEARVEKCKLLCEFLQTISCRAFPHKRQTFNRDT